MNNEKTEKSNDLDLELKQLIETIDNLVKQGDEHPEFEFKSKLSIGKASHHFRSKFLKDVMSIANSKGLRPLTFSTNDLRSEKVEKFLNSN